MSETVTVLAGSDVVRQPESTTTFIVADPLPEVFVHRTGRKQQHPSPDECIKLAAEKLSEFAAATAQNYNASDASRSGSNIAMYGAWGQQVNAGSDATKSSCPLRDVTAESSRSLLAAQDGNSAFVHGTAAIPSGNDVGSASKRVASTWQKKAAEVHRSASTRLTGA